MSVKNDEIHNYVGYTTKQSGLPFDPLDASVRDVLFVRMQEDVQISLQEQAIAFAKRAYRKLILLPMDYTEDVFLPYDAPKPPPRNSFLSWFKRG